MRGRNLSIIAAGILLALVGPSAAGELPVVIRTYDASGLPEAERGAALGIASAILEDAGLAVARLACDEVEPGRTDDRCRLPLRSSELSLRLVRLRATEDGSGRVTLGYSLVELHGRAGALATVYVDRIADLAAASGVDLPTLLGRAIAHEVGHLLLGTAAHAQAGVMRASWSPDALRQSTARDWRFTRGDAAALRAAARRRAAGQTPAPDPMW